MKHGVNEEELLTAAETRPEETPDWVRTVAEKAQAEEDAATALEMEAPEQMEESDTSWLSDLLKDEEEAAPPVSSEAPDWLTDSAADSIATAQAGTIAEEEAEPVLDEATLEEEPAPAWLLAEEEPAELEAPSWILEEIAEESPTSTSVEPTSTSVEPTSTSVEPTSTSVEPTSTSVETAAQEPEVPSWLLEEEMIEETPLPIFAMEQPAEEAEEAPVPVMEFEYKLTADLEPEPALELPLTEDALSQARTTLASGDVTAAAEYYEKLIKGNQNVDEAIADITEALDMRYPVDIGLWQALGDAYVKKSQLQDALDTYTKAEELLR